MKTLVVIRTTFSATHNWPECPIEEVDYLRYEHRHTFYVTMKWSVGHDDRAIEFIMQKNVVDAELQRHYDGRNLGRRSCEMIAKELMAEFDADFVSVFEDDENGAEVYREDCDQLKSGLGVIGRTGVANE